MTDQNGGGIQMVLRHKGDQRRAVIAAVLRRGLGAVFTSQEVHAELPAVARGTVSSTLYLLRHAGVVRSIQAGSSRTYQYEGVRATTVERAYRSVSRVDQRARVRSVGTRRRREYRALPRVIRPKMEDAAVLAAIKLALAKAVKYDRLLTWLKITDAEASESIGEE